MPARVVISRSNPVAPDPRVEKEAQSLSAAGYSVQIIGWDRTGQLATQEDRGGIRIHRLPIRAEYARGVGNLPALLRWQMGLARWLVHHRRDYDIIHACDFDTILPALWCQRLWGKVVVYDIFDFYADHLRATPEWVKSLIRRVDLSLVRRASAVILADDSRREQIAGAAPRLLEVIYNSPPDVFDQVHPAERPAGSALHLAYIGLLQVERGLLQMLDALKRHPDWTFDLAGFGGDQERILASAAGLVNVRWHGRIPYERALQLSAAADALFATYDPAIPNHRYASPNKLFEAMMLGKPVLVCEHTNMDRIVAGLDCGLMIPYDDIPALEAALRRLASDAALRRRLGENARRAYVETYGWERMQSRLLSLYASICSLSSEEVLP
jgi:glycosyltransferase involved in cell wall biosynthesis